MLTRAASAQESEWASKSSTTKLPRTTLGIRDEQESEDADTRWGAVGKLWGRCVGRTIASAVALRPVQGFPATHEENRGSPALCVSGSFQGNQRVFGAPFCLSRVSLGKLASFPESESWSGAKSGAKLRKSARYPGIFQVYRGFPGIPAKYPVFCRFWPQNSLRHGSEPPQNDEFHGARSFPGVSRGN